MRKLNVSAVSVCGALFVATSAASCSSVVGITSASGSAGPTAEAVPSMGGSSSSSGEIFNTSACDLNPPVADDPCDDPTLRCRYGNGASPACDSVYDCNGSGWVALALSTERCNDVCPSAFDMIVPGASCGYPWSGACTYYEATCGCIANSPSDGGVGSGGGMDGGDAGATGDHHWACVQPGAGCPARRPALGDPCVTPITCDYGSCLFGEQLAFVCAGQDTGGTDNNSWAYSSVPSCP